MIELLASTLAVLFLTAACFFLIAVVVAMPLTFLGIDLRPVVDKINHWIYRKTLP